MEAIAQVRTKALRSESIAASRSCRQQVTTQVDLFIPPQKKPNNAEQVSFISTGCGAIGSAVDCSLMNSDLLVPGSSPGSRMPFCLFTKLTADSLFFVAYHRGAGAHLLIVDADIQFNHWELSAESLVCALLNPVLAYDRPQAGDITHRFITVSIMTAIIKCSSTHRICRRS